MPDDVILSIYTREAASRRCDGYDAQLRPSQPGNQNRFVGKVLADQVNQLSYVIVRRRYRVAERKLAYQCARAGFRGYDAFRTFYQVERTTYITATISWAEGAVTEMRAWPTQREAERYAKLLHNGVAVH